MFAHALANVLAPILFMIFPACDSDFDSNCHSPVDSWRDATTYVSVDGNPDHDTLVMGPDSPDAKAMGTTGTVAVLPYKP